MKATNIETVVSPMAVVLPLALAQFICSFAASNMNVAVSAIAGDLGTDVRGVQLTITLFTLTMAALMIPGSKLTDIWGRKFCLMAGLMTYGAGALLASFAWSLSSLQIGYSLLEGVGSALLIPPVYILITVTFPDLRSRAKYFGIISAAAGIGAAAGPLIGGLLTSAISWRAAFVVQVIVVASVIWLSRHIDDPGIQGAKPRFDLLGAFLSAAGLFFVVLGVLLSGDYGWITASKDFKIGNTVVIQAGGISPVWLSVGIGAVILAWFFLHIRSAERGGRNPLLSPHIFRNRVSNLGLVTQNVQWLILQGSFFVISVFLQTVRGYNAIQTGLILTPATVGILVSSGLAQRMAQRRSQGTLVRVGFLATMAGLILILLLASAASGIVNFVPGLLLTGLGVGIMLTASVNVVQSSFPERDQGEISGLSRSVSNLGSSLGTALVGSVLVSSLAPQTETYGIALLTMVAIAGVGLIAALFIPSTFAPAGERAGTAGEGKEPATS